MQQSLTPQPERNSCWQTYIDKKTYIDSNTHHINRALSFVRILSFFATIFSFHPLLVTNYETLYSEKERTTANLINLCLHQQDRLLLPTLPVEVSKVWLQTLQEIHVGGTHIVISSLQKTLICKPYDKNPLHIMFLWIKQICISPCAT
jgi:hypothetical protein